MKINRKERHILCTYSSCIEIDQEGINIRDFYLVWLKKQTDKDKKALKFFLFWGMSESHSYKGCLKLPEKAKQHFASDNVQNQY